MAYPRRMFLSVLLLALAAAAAFAADAQKTVAAMSEGVELFRNGQYERAILAFHDVILDETAEASKPSAYFLTAKAYMALGKLEDAGRNLEHFLATYPTSTDYPEAVYQKGRLLLLQEDYESAIQVLQNFISSFPKSPLISSGYYWVGESLYNLGRLDDAMKVFEKVVREYPTSVKIEAAQYRVSLIELRRKEIELTKLLKWSHEDFLKTVEEFQKRERTYEQAIEAYQKKLSSNEIVQYQKTINDLRQELAAKAGEAATLSAKVGELTAQAAKLSGGAAALGAAEQVAASSQAEGARLKGLQDLLALKAEALALKELYLTWLEKSMESSK